MSGTLSYAMGAGLAIVSTPYLYARELLAGGRGLLVPPASPEALAESLSALLLNPERREADAARAYERGRQMTWPTIGAAYRNLFDEVAGEAVESRSRRWSGPARRRMSPDPAGVGGIVPGQEPGPPAARSPELPAGPR